MHFKMFAVVIALTLASMSANAQTSINLNGYALGPVYSLDRLNGTSGGISGLEASAVTYNRDTGTLFFVGDEGTGVVEISRTGQTLGHMNFNWAGTGSSNNDSEAIAYIGGGQFVVGEERLQNAYSFAYVAGGTVNLGSAPFVSFGPTVGNVGIEGISYDSRNGNFVAVKQDNPATLSIYNSLTFSTGAGLDVVADIAFSGASSLFGLTQLSDVQTLGILGNDNLLVLSTGTTAGDSRKLIEIKRDGTILSSFDLTNVLPRNAIEGVTIDENGTIYLVAEQDQLSGAPANPQSQLIVLTAPVPEPETWAMMLAGLGLLGFAARRRKTG